MHRLFSILMKNETKVVIAALVFLAVVKFLLAFPLDNGIPGGTDSSAHLFKVWYISNFGITSWNGFWYGGSPFLRYYPPLAYLIPPSISGIFGAIISYKLINNIFLVLMPIPFYFL